MNQIKRFALSALFFRRSRMQLYSGVQRFFARKKTIDPLTSDTIIQSKSEPTSFKSNSNDSERQIEEMYLKSKGYVLSKDKSKYDQEAIRKELDSLYDTFGKIQEISQLEKFIVIITNFKVIRHFIDLAMENCLRLSMKHHNDLSSACLILHCLSSFKIENEEAFQSKWSSIELILKKINKIIEAINFDKLSMKEVIPTLCSLAQLQEVSDLSKDNLEKFLFFFSDNKRLSSCENQELAILISSSLRFSRIEHIHIEAIIEEIILRCGMKQISEDPDIDKQAEKSSKTDETKEGTKQKDSQSKQKNEPKKEKETKKAQAKEHSGTESHKEGNADKNALKTKRLDLNSIVIIINAFANSGLKNDDLLSAILIRVFGITNKGKPQTGGKHEFEDEEKDFSINLSYTSIAQFAKDLAKLEFTDKTLFGCLYKAFVFKYKAADKKDLTPILNIYFANMMFRQNFQKYHFKEDYSNKRLSREFELRGEEFYDKVFPLFYDHKDNISEETAISIIMAAYRCHVFRRFNLKTIYVLYDDILSRMVHKLKLESSPKNMNNLDNYLVAGALLFKQPELDLIITKIKQELTEDQHQRYNELFAKALNEIKINKKPQTAN